MSRSGHGPIWLVSPGIWFGWAAIAAFIRWSAGSSRMNGCALFFSFHPLLIGGNPFTASAIYTLIPYLERRWGVHFAMGGTGCGGARPGRFDPGTRAAGCAAMPRSSK